MTAPKGLPPRVSVIVPLYNKGRYIAETLRAVARQTMAELEVIVVDNDSTDDGPAVVASFPDPRVSLRGCAKRGPGSARNQGLEKARGDWVLFLDADDLIEPDHLETLLAVAAANPAAEIVAGGWVEFRDGSPDERKVMEPSGQGVAGGAWQSALATAPWCLHAAIVKRSALVPSRHWVEELDLSASEDAVFWFRLLCHVEVAYSASTGALYRRETVNARDPVADLALRCRALKDVSALNLDYLQTIGRAVDPAQLAGLVRVYEQLAERAARSGDDDTRRSALEAAAAHLDRLRGMAPRGLSIGMALRVFLGVERFIFFRALLRGRLS